MVTLHKSLEGAVNVYTMDVRGTGRSTLLHCESSESPTTTTQYDGDKIYLEVPECAKKLHKKYGNLASFSTTSAAMDISSFIAKHTNDADTIVYGLGFGTMSVQRLMQLNPPSVNGYVLDSTVASSVTPDKKSYGFQYDAEFSDVSDRFMKLCPQDRGCASHFNATSLSATLHRVLLEFAINPNSTCAKMVAEASNIYPSAGLRFTLGELLMDASARSMIPPAVHRLNRCDANDVDVLTTFFAAHRTKKPAPGHSDSMDSYVQTLVVVLSEMWETPSPIFTDLEARFETLSMSDSKTADLIPLYCQYSKERSPACEEVGVAQYEADSLLYPHDQYWADPATVPRHASVLLMHGRLDPENHIKHARTLLETLNTSKKELVTFDYSPAVTVEATPFGDDGKNCGMELLISYVANNANLRRVDKSCVREMPAFDMKVSSELAATYFGTEDVYDGVPNSVEQNGRVKAAFR